MEMDSYFGMATRRMQQTQRDMNRAARAGDREGVAEYARKFARDQREFNDKIEETTELLERANRALGETFDGVDELMEEHQALEKALDDFERILPKRGR